MVVFYFLVFGCRLVLFMCSFFHFSFFLIFFLCPSGGMVKMKLDILDAGGGLGLGVGNVFWRFLFVSSTAVPGVPFMLTSTQCCRQCSTT